MVRLKAVLCRNCRISKIQIGYKFIIHAKHICHIVFKCASEMSYSRAIDCDRRLSPLTSLASCISAQNGQNRIMTKSPHVLPGMLFIVRTCPLILTAATNCTIGSIYVTAETKQRIVLLESYMSKLKRNNELYYWNHICQS